MDVILPPPSRREGPSATEPLSVMVVDDHEIFRRGICDLLSSTGDFKVVAEASCCKDALALITTTPIDLVLVAISLPDADGIETLCRLKGVTPTLDIVILANRIDKNILLEAMLAGASGYLTKGASGGELVGALRGLRYGELAMFYSVATKAVRLLVQKCNDLLGQRNGFGVEFPASLQNGAKTADLPQPGAPILNGLPQNRSFPPPRNELTPQEYRVFQLMRRGLSNKQIAAHLTISPYTVGKHVQRILRKLGVMNRTQAVLRT